MKVLFVIDNLAGGGAQKLICDLIMRIRNEQVEILLLSNNSEKYYMMLKEKGIPIYILPDSHKTVSSKLKYMWKVIKHGDYSVVHANLFPAIYYIAIIKKLHKKECPPILMTEHSTDNNRRHKRYLQSIERYIYSSFDHIISISKETQDALLKWLGRSADSRFSVIENGIDIGKYHTARAYKKEYVFPEYKDGDQLIGMVASFTPQKNHKMMIEAMAMIPDEYKLILVGEGPLSENIKELVREKKLNSRVIFLGFRKDVAEIMKTVDIICVPSMWEGFGLVAVEAMACGVPVAVANVPGLSEVVGEAGIQFDPRNPRDIANALKKSKDRMAIDKENTDKRVARANSFSILRMKDEYLELFSKYCNL